MKEKSMWVSQRRGMNDCTQSGVVESRETTEGRNVKFNSDEGTTLEVRTFESDDREDVREDTTERREDGWVSKEGKSSSKWVVVVEGRQKEMRRDENCSTLINVGVESNLY